MSPTGGTKSCTDSKLHGSQAADSDSLYAEAGIAKLKGGSEEFSHERQRLRFRSQASIPLSVANPPGLFPCLHLCKLSKYSNSS